MGGTSPRRGNDETPSEKQQRSIFEKAETGFAFHDGEPPAIPVIVYDPKKFLKKVMPEARVKRMLKGNVTVKRAALSFIDGIDFLDKKSIARVANKTVKSYRERISADPDVKEEILDDPRLLIQRVENEVVLQVSAEIRSTYGDEIAEWLPSDAEEPDPEHQLNYGKTFKISEGINGEIPGERIGCRCGMRILSVKETQLELG